jgi:hypothetical protein
MFTQVAPLERIRIPLISLAILALAAYAALLAMPRIQIGALEAVSAPVTSVQIQPTVEPIACGHGAYVTGDMAGDTSPSSVYATLCGPR